MERELTVAEVLAKHVKMEPKIVCRKITIWSTEALRAMQEYSDIKTAPLNKKIEELKKLNQWISLKKQKPIATESGAWDGLKSEQILVEDKNGVRYVAVMYEGTLDGSYFCNFYSSLDWEIENVINWKHIN